MNTLPDEIIYKLSNNAGELAIFLCTHVCREWRQIIIDNWRGPITEDALMYNAANLNSLNIVKYFIDIYFDIPWFVSTLFTTHGNLAALRYLHSISPIQSQITKYAINGGHTHILDFMIENHIEINKCWDGIQNPADLLSIVKWVKLHPEFAINMLPIKCAAATYGNLEAYKSCYGSDTDLYFVKAMMNGHIEIIKYMSDNGHIVRNFTPIPTDHNHGGVIEIIKYIIENKHLDAFRNVQHSHIVDIVIGIGDIELLKYCESLGYEINDPNYIKNIHMAEYVYNRKNVLDENVFLEAISHKNIDIVKYYIATKNIITENSLYVIYALDLDIVISAIELFRAQNPDLEIVNDYTTAFEDYESEDAVVEKLKYLFNQCGPDDNYIDYACLANAVKLLLFLIETGDRLEYYNYNTAIECDSDKIVGYLLEHIEPDYNRIFCYAIINNSIKIVQLLINSGKIPLIDDYCSLASADNKYQILKLLHKNNFPWGGYVINNAIINNSLKMLRYAANNNCPLPQEYAIMSKRVAKYISNEAHFSLRKI